MIETEEDFSGHYGEWSSLRVLQRDGREGPMLVSYYASGNNSNGHDDAFDGYSLVLVDALTLSEYYERLDAAALKLRVAKIAPAYKRNATSVLLRHLASILAVHNPRFEYRIINSDHQESISGNNESNGSNNTLMVAINGALNGLAFNWQLAVAKVATNKAAPFIAKTLVQPLIVATSILLQANSISNIDSNINTNGLYTHAVGSIFPPTNNLSSPPNLFAVSSLFNPYATPNLAASYAVLNRAVLTKLLPDRVFTHRNHDNNGLRINEP
ncbi:hypothetical protein HK100_003000, partial [Physocladia obscura]